MNASKLMRQVALALAPGLLLQAAYFGPGVVVQVITCVGTAAALHTLRGRTGLDEPGVVSALLIAAALPPLAPWWIGVSATAMGLVLAREVYGGTGANLFNPAMAGYAAVLIAFPAELARWPAADAPAIALGAWSGLGSVDGMTAATTLEAFRFADGATEAELFATDARFGNLGGSGWEWIAAAWAAGGIWLLREGAIRWHGPVGLLVGLGTAALLGADAGSSAGYGSPLLHWFTGGAMLAAFFIVTDPVTSPVDRWHQFLFAAGIGVVLWIIRAFGHYADGVAFAVLLGNALVPLIDRLPVRRQAPPGATADAA